MKKTALFLLLSLPVLGQINGSIVGLGKPYKDKIALRWNTTNYQVFRQLVTDGVWIDRMVVNANNQVDQNGWTRLTKEPIKAKTLPEFQRSPHSGDTAVAIVAEGLYGKTEYPADLKLVDRIRFNDMDQQNRHLMVSLYAAVGREAALMAGLGYEDLLPPDPKKNYVYRIVPRKPKGVPGTIETGYIYVAGRDVAVKPIYFGLKARGLESAVVLTWPKKESPFTGYHIERSSDQKKFTRINSSIYLPDMTEDSTEVNFHYHDSVENYRRYYYRLVGVNAFGEEMRFEETVTAMAEDLTPVTPPLLTLKKEGKVLLFTWPTPEERDLKGYYLLHGRTIEANDGLVSDKMIAPTAKQFTHTVPTGFSASYYRLMLADTAGNVCFTNAVYAFEPDLIPPAPPTGLSGKIDTNGVVTVKWNLDLKEEALRGYKVLIANQGNHSFAPVSDVVPDTTYTFVTELKTLTRKLWVKVIAVDGNFNHSEPSKALVLERPDVVPPAAPQILRYTNDQKGIELHWSTAKTSDFKENILYRKKAEQEEWQEHFRTVKASSFLDKDVLPGTTYTYSLRAVDSSGLYSDYAHPLVLRTSTASVADKINVTGTYSAASKTIQLKWNASTEKVAFYVLYADKGRGLELYKSLPPGTLTYQEPGTTSPKGKYALKIKYENATESDLLICK